MNSINEQINVWVFFKGKLVSPYIFFWKDRQIKIDKINLMHQTLMGDDVLLHFSVSSEGNFYRIMFNTSSLKWFLEELEEGN